MVDSTPLDPRTFNLLLLFSSTAFIIWGYRLFLDLKRIIELRTAMLTNRLVHVHGLGSRSFLFENVTSYHYQSLASTRPPASAQKMREVLVPFTVDLKSLKILMRPRSDEIQVSFALTSVVPHTIQLVWGLSKQVFSNEDDGVLGDAPEHEEEQELVRRGRRNPVRNSPRFESLGSVVSGGGGGGGSGGGDFGDDLDEDQPTIVMESGVEMARRTAQANHDSFRSHHAHPTHVVDASPGRRSGSESDSEGRNGNDGAPLLRRSVPSSVGGLHEPFALKAHCVALSRPRAFPASRTEQDPHALDLGNHPTSTSTGTPTADQFTFDELCPFPASLANDLQRRIKHAKRRARPNRRGRTGTGGSGVGRDVKGSERGVAPLTILLRPDWSGKLQGVGKAEKRQTAHQSPLFTPSLSNMGLNRRQRPFGSLAEKPGGGLSLHAILVSIQLPTAEQVEQWEKECGGCERAEGGGLETEGIEVGWQLDEVLNTVDGETLTAKEVFGLKEEDDEASEECVVCLTEPKDTILLPCRHLCVCRHCFRQIDKCPVCRTPFETYMVFAEPPLGNNEAPEPSNSYPERDAPLRTVTRGENGLITRVARFVGIQRSYL